MKKLLLTLFVTVSFSNLFSQAFTNGGFESWYSNVIMYPQYYYVNSNLNNINNGFPSNVLMVADPQAGSFAVQLTTVSNPSDTSFAYIANGDPGSGQGGIPYTLKPLTATGFYKCAIPAGDTALFLVMFKEAGTIISFDLYKFIGTQSTYAPFTLSLNIPALSNPDSVLIAAASSNAFIFNGIPGSMLQIDNISFTGVITQPANLNGSFENWSSQTIYKPSNWIAVGDTALRTTDKVSGSYAIKLTTMSYGGGGVGPSVLTNGNLAPGFMPSGGKPYTSTADTLVGMYKFIATGVDSATVWIELRSGGTPVGGNYVGLPPVAAYTPFSIPFSAGATPDTMLLVFASSFSNTSLSDVGSQLFLDDIYLKSQPLNTPSIANWNQFGLIKLFPNPAETFTTISWTSQSSEATKINLHDAAGKLVSQYSAVGTGFQSQTINLDGLQRGNYTVTISQNGVQQTRLLMVK